MEFFQNNAIAGVPRLGLTISIIIFPMHILYFIPSSGGLLLIKAKFIQESGDT